MPGEEAFLSRLAEYPDDDTTRLVYADWLEERGDPRAAYLRAEVDLAAIDPEEEGHAEAEERLAAARQGLDATWLAAAGRAYDLVLTGYAPPARSPSSSPSAS